MIINARNNQFDFRFPRTFIPEEINKKYKDYLLKLPGNMITEPIDFLNYGVQGVNLTGISFTPVEQTSKIGRARMYRTAVDPAELFSKEISIQMQLLDGYLNYFMLWDILLHYYSHGTKELYIPDGTSLRILDSEGYIIVSSIFKRVLFKEISSLNLAFNNNSPDFTTFDIGLVYNTMELKIDID